MPGDGVPLQEFVEESFELLQSGQLVMAVIYIIGSMVLGLSGLGLGILITR